MTPEWIRPAEAAARLDMAESTLRTKVNQGLIPSHRDARFLRFTEADIEAYVASCAQPAANAMQRTRPKKRRAA